MFDGRVRKQLHAGIGGPWRGVGLGARVSGPRSCHMCASAAGLTFAIPNPNPLLIPTLTHKSLATWGLANWKRKLSRLEWCQSLWHLAIAHLLYRENKYLRKNQAEKSCSNKICPLIWNFIIFKIAMNKFPFNISYIVYYLIDSIWLSFQVKILLCVPTPLLPAHSGGMQIFFFSSPGISFLWLIFCLVFRRVFCISWWSRSAAVPPRLTAQTKRAKTAKRPNGTQAEMKWNGMDADLVMDPKSRRLEMEISDWQVLKMDSRSHKLQPKDGSQSINSKKNLWKIGL